MTFSSFSLYKKISESQKGFGDFGARDGTRTHTALTTRTSNVLVYHSNTLASALKYYNYVKRICQYIFEEAAPAHVVVFRHNI